MCGASTAVPFCCPVPCLSPTLANVSNGGKDTSELLVEAWVKTIGTQEHFNQIEMDIRKTAVALVGGAIGATTLTDNLVAKTMLLVAGLTAWLAFFFMDFGWYHRLLLGAVEQGEYLESELHKLNVPIKLSQHVRSKSPIKLFGWEIHSDQKIVLFYGFGIAILAAAITAVWVVPREEKSDNITVEVPAEGLSISVGRTGKEKAAPKTD
jgi:hypothetical protein